LSLAAALSERDLECLLLLAGDGASQHTLSQAPCEVLSLGTDALGGDEDLSRTLELASHYGCAGVVVDSYRVGTYYLSTLRDVGYQVAVIDDLASFAFPTQVVINGGVAATELPYRSSSGDTRFLLGPEFALLRREFWDLGAREIQSTAANVVVTMGGADSANTSEIVLQGLANLRAGLQITVVIGPYFRHEESVREAAACSQHPVCFVLSPPDMLDLMLRADLVISAAGQTLYELAAAGTPTVAVCVADNQRPNLEAFAEYGVVAPVGFATCDELRAGIASTVDCMLLDTDRRRQMSVAAQRLISGGGARKVASVLETVIQL
jgi:UDP-2,4-diacetamido-2,4,6-trideoxy-beta-L-altropyranose hydrolase